MKFYKEPLGFLMCGRKIRRAAWPVEMQLWLHPDGWILQHDATCWASCLNDFLATDWELVK